jgi:hypothetical protein
MYRAVRLALVRLADPQRPEQHRIRDLKLQDRLYVRGLLPEHHPLLDRREPRTRITRDEMLALSAEDRNVATHYLTARVSDWKGEVESTVLLFLSVRGGLLYIEFLGTAMPPIKADYHGIDTMERLSPSVYRRAAARALLRAPIAILTAPLHLIEPLGDALLRGVDSRAEQRTISSRLAFDYGATGSVRAFGAEWDRPNFLHNLDSRRYIDVVGRQILDCLGEVLEQFGYSVKEFTDRKTNIVNRTTVTVHGSMSGSVVNAGDGNTVSNAPGEAAQ